MEKMIRLDSDIVFRNVRSELPKLTVSQLDSVQHEIRSMLLDLDMQESNNDEEE